MSRMRKTKNCHVLLVLFVCNVYLTKSALCFTAPTMMASGSGKSDNKKIDKGFNILGTASKFIPQGKIVGTVKETWKFAWKRMMAELAPQDEKGQYSRPTYTFSNQIGTESFPDEASRYHLYTGNPCPWCHRAKLALTLRSVSQKEISTTSLTDDPTKASRGGWIISDPQKDPFRCTDLREVYDLLCEGDSYQGRCTAPLLVDKLTRRIVSNESSDIVRMLNGLTFGNDDEQRIDLYPSHLQTEIDETNEWVYRLLNNGVYRCGFSTQQSAYDAACEDVREGLEKVDSILADRDYLCGDEFTEADLRLLPTVLRFDGAYAPLFKAGGAHLRIRDYSSLHAWLKRCWDLNGGAVRESIDLADACGSYWKQLFPLNPGGIVPRLVTPEDIGLES